MEGGKVMREDEESWMEGRSERQKDDELENTRGL